MKPSAPGTPRGRPFDFSGGASVTPAPVGAGRAAPTDTVTRLRVEPALTQRSVASPRETAAALAPKTSAQARPVEGRPRGGRHPAQTTVGCLARGLGWASWCRSSPDLRRCCPRCHRQACPLRRGSGGVPHGRLRGRGILQRFRGYPVCLGQQSVKVKLRVLSTAGREFMGAVNHYNAARPGLGCGFADAAQISLAGAADVGGSSFSRDATVSARVTSRPRRCADAWWPGWRPLAPRRLSQSEYIRTGVVAQAHVNSPPPGSRCWP